MPFLFASLDVEKGFLFTRSFAARAKSISSCIAPAFLSPHKCVFLHCCLLDGQCPKNTFDFPLFHPLQSEHSLSSKAGLLQHVHPIAPLSFLISLCFSCLHVWWDIHATPASYAVEMCVQTDVSRQPGCLSFRLVCMCESYATDTTQNIFSANSFRSDLRILLWIRLRMWVRLILTEICGVPHSAGSAMCCAEKSDGFVRMRPKTKLSLIKDDSRLWR